MQKNKSLTVLQNYQQQFKSRKQDIDHKADLTKVPKLQNLIDLWKLQVQANKSNLDKSLAPSTSCINDKDIFIDHLKNKIACLQKKLQTLCSRHVQICQQLFKELQKRVYFQQILKKQNVELNQQLAEMTKQVNIIVATIDFKNCSSLENSQIKSSKHLVKTKFNKVIKENIPPAQQRFSKDLAFRLQKQKRNRKFPRLLSEKNRFKVLSSINKSSKSITQDQIDQEKLQKKMALEYGDLYYSKSKSKLQFGSGMSQRSKGKQIQRGKGISQRRKSRTFIEEKVDILMQKRKSKTIIEDNN